MSKHDNLIKAILLMSQNSKDFNIASTEWDLLRTEDIPKSTCLCKHHPIRECCFIINNLTNQRTMVGNCCLEHFGGMPDVDWYFQGLRSIKNLTNPNLKMVQYLFAQKTISEFEYKFFRDRHNKKKYTYNQRQFQQSVLIGLKERFYKNE